jgi:hypothetical protein
MILSKSNPSLASYTKKYLSRANEMARSLFTNTKAENKSVVATMYPVQSLQHLAGDMVEINSGNHDIKTAVDVGPPYKPRSDVEICDGDDRERAQGPRSRVMKIAVLRVHRVHFSRCLWALATH